MPDSVTRAAAALWEAAGSGIACPPVRSIIGESDIEAAYAVQERNTERRLAEGARLVGRKIGLTARSVQAQLGVSQPDYGMLFHDMDVANGGEVPAGRLIQPKIEAEIAFLIGRDLDDDRLTTADVLSAIAWAVPALEIVDSRVEGWNIRITDTIADNASSGLFVLGHEMRRLDAVDLLTCGMVLEGNGEPVSTGAGAACLGSPVNATLWLARVMARSGRPLRAGDIVLSGALGPMVPASPGTTYEARIEGLGSVRVGFGGEESQ
ncbi:2-keto-4-pentenoate hydratase [Azospirillum lipoferum]|uniref:2-keto-4-pentenoate hydratase n=1 Tax=Azospirillum lipoferum TaxID=193 RepID=A0A5A9GE80_AZOLI|nr:MULTISPECIES: fumarylacetoacetate hydrolase family protein [Azospirillum]KAA0592711.1 2-keto-4-pentenoate hydratase [Azospirillum lipoferum]MCP1614346.1 2-keto-4-pentenoate hydratase [Azospirillum lipoferum]MDW5531876.1 fumarylacetoacetate hydrolase family protein [Azospirillum sp. NL1]